MQLRAVSQQLRQGMLTKCDGIDVGCIFGVSIAGQDRPKQAVLSPPVRHPECQPRQHCHWLLMV